MARKLKLERTEAQIKEDLSLFLSREVANPRLRLATITAVRVSDDLSEARVMIDTLDRSQAESIALDLQNNAGLFRSHLASLMTTRRVPLLRFEADKTIDEAIRVEELLKQTKR